MDTLKLSEELEKEQVFPAEQARAFSRIWAQMSRETYATKADIDAATADIRSDLRLLKWMAGFALTGLAGVLWALVTMATQLGRLTEAVSRIAP